MFAPAAERPPRRFSQILFTSLTLIGAGFSIVLMLTLWQIEIAMEEISLHHWLDAEARRYALDWQRSGDAATGPNPLEFDLWRDDGSQPAWLESYQQPGVYEHLLGDEDKHFLVTQHPSGSGLIYLVFKDNADDYLDGYEGRLHVLSLLLALGGVVVVLLVSWLLTQRLSRPLQSVERKVRNLVPSEKAIEADAPYAELRTIESAMADVQRDIAYYLRREQEFSHFASHELRTPLTVVQGSAEVLHKVLGEQASGRRAVVRIDAACREMTVLIETFLLLGRGELGEEQLETLNVQQVLTEAIDAALAKRGDRDRPLIRHDTTQIDANAGLLVRAPRYFLRVLIDNLVRNALVYGSGQIEILLHPNGLSVRNAYAEPAANSHGHGYGLVICERICERMGWRLDIQSDKQQYQVGVAFDGQTATA